MDRGLSTETSERPADPWQWLNHSWNWFDHWRPRYLHWTGQAPLPISALLGAYFPPWYSCATTTCCKRQCLRSASFSNTFASRVRRFGMLSGVLKISQSSVVIHAFCAVQLRGGWRPTPLLQSRFISSTITFSDAASFFDGLDGLAFAIAL